MNSMRGPGSQFDMNELNDNFRRSPASGKYIKRKALWKRYAYRYVRDTISYQEEPQEEYDLRKRDDDHARLLLLVDDGKSKVT